MKLKICLPFAVFTEQNQIHNLIVDTTDGAFGLLEHRQDCVALVVPGILSYRMPDGEDIYVAVDQGVLVKVGEQITMSVRRAYSGVPLTQLHQMVSDEFLKLDAQQQLMRNVMAKLESGFVRRSININRHDES
ncbi:F0F1 ATP synthase subunit epsilon [Rheinheimera sp. UJ63]|uniref:F0F1 ATP synthase subunit epsilon n=1 Tax=Rheinheimera sp. UJ63 TaxID=2910157 RepID=UPI001F3F9A68|nr:F0F1 ATP synthase subunit epsilon [Rheinheimera sp. UJ63]MCF4008689.1 F0F1 ATP synthase subunit epsilon [Rheinheimera sp. UJ63]